MEEVVVMGSHFVQTVLVLLEFLMTMTGNVLTLCFHLDGGILLTHISHSAAVFTLQVVLLLRAQDVNQCVI